MTTLQKKLDAMRCDRCGHPADWHRHDDADPTPPTDPDCTFRCLGYDCEVGGRPPKNGCDCPDWVAPSEAYAAIAAAETILTEAEEETA